MEKQTAMQEMLQWVRQILPYEIGFFLYYVLTGIFIYICIIQIKKNDNGNK